jgi:predicted RNA-binding Zn-ribbon protein involved in translation (DUF1610 family)
MGQESDYFGGPTYQEFYGWPAPITPPIAPHIGHSNHLCDMSDRGLVTIEQMKELIRNPKFICKKCGRAAKKAENLCEPISLDYTCGMCGESFSSKAKLTDHAKTHKE